MKNKKEKLKYYFFIFESPFNTLLLGLCRAKLHTVQVRSAAFFEFSLLQCQIDQGGC
jgi:hypothetical protein